MGSGVPRRATIVLALVTWLAWSCLLFGIGLDDLADGRTKPGVIFSLAILPLFIGGLLYAIWRLLRARLAKRIAGP
jgi:hypothetical protein